MIITIRVPDNTIKMQYATQDGNDYDQWKTLVFGEIVSIKAEQDTDNRYGRQATGAEYPSNIAPMGG